MIITIDTFRYPLVKIQKRLNMATEIVELPMKKGDVPLLCQRLPESVYCRDMGVSIAMGVPQNGNIW